MSDELKRLTAVVTAIPGLSITAVAAAAPTPSIPSAMDWALQLRAVQADETIHNMPFPVTADSVAAAIVAADALGRSATGS